MQNLVLLLLLLHANLVLFHDGALDTAAARKSDQGEELVTLGLTNNEHVGKTGGKLVAALIPEVDDVEATGVLVTVGDLTDATNVLSR